MRTKLDVVFYICFSEYLREEESFSGSAPVKIAEEAAGHLHCQVADDSSSACSLPITPERFLQTRKSPDIITARSSSFSGVGLCIVSCQIS